MNTFVFLVPILTSLGAFAMIFGIIYLKSRENMAMIEKGMNPKQFANRPAPYRSLKTGLLLSGSGLGLLVAYFISRNTQYDFGAQAMPVWFSCIAIGGGLGLIGSYAIEKKEILSRRAAAEE